MRIHHITPQELRKMENQDGLVLQGCGGNPSDWRKHLNYLLTEAGILKNGSTFKNIYAFSKGDYPCILFPFQDGVDLDMGKLAIWRLQTYDTFGGTWLSDYVPTQLGGFIQEPQQRVKPDCELIGKDGNIFNLMGLAAYTLRENDMKEQATEMINRITQCQSYHSALSIIGEYVNITGPMEMEGMAMDELD